MASRSSSELPKTIPSFRLTARQHQLNHLLAGPQRHTMLVGGARSGKSFLIVRAILIRALRAKNSRHAMLRLRFNAARASIWLDTLPKVARLCFPGVELRDRRQDGFVELPNGSEIWLGGLDEKQRVEKILGQEYASIYFCECSQIPYSSVIIARTRLAQNVGLVLRAYYDLNPVGTGHWTNRLFIQHRDPLSLRSIDDPSIYAHAFINPEDNADNLPKDTLDELRALPSRHYARFYKGIYQAEIDGALWTFETIEHARCLPEDVPHDLKRVVVSVDPSGTRGDEDQRSDNVGIVAVGLGIDNTAYVLADRTCNLPPEAWARVAVTAYREFKADRIVAEQNFGGDMVRAVLHTVDRNVPVHLVNASRGKTVRAEPVSALYGYERDGSWHKDQVRHAGEFRELEDQMLNFSTAGYLGDRSPDRCLAAGSMIETVRGAVPIEDVSTDDLVLTRKGYRRVLAARRTARAAETMTVVTTIGEFSATPDHLVLTQKGWIRVDALAWGDILCSCAMKPLPFGRTSIVFDRQLVPAYVVRSYENAELRPVYDLAIDGDHEFFANGHLVHNCDALVWALTDLLVEPMPGEAILGYYRLRAREAAEKKAAAEATQRHPAM